MIALLCASGLVMAIVHGALIAPRLPEPPDGDEVGKLPYAALLTRRRLAGLVAVSAIAQMGLLPPPGYMRPLWFVYGSAVAALIWVDACTTWLPTKMVRLAWAEMVVAVGAMAWLAGDWRQAVGVIAGAAAAAGFLWVFWRFSRGGIGFGDVRLAPLVGAVAATMGVTGWLTAMLAGSAVGVVWGLVTARRHPAPGTARGFAYGPALWAGPYVALLWSALAG